MIATGRESRIGFYVFDQSVFWVAHKSFGYLVDLATNHVQGNAIADTESVADLEPLAILEAASEQLRAQAKAKAA